MTNQGETTLLVKATTIAPEGNLRLSLGASDFRSNPLMPHVDTALKGPAAGKLRIDGPGTSGSRWYQVHIANRQASPWDLAHALREGGPDVAMGVEFVEPDLEQHWNHDRTGPDSALAVADCVTAVAQDTRFPHEPDDLWYRDAAHGGFDAALAALAAIPAGRRSTVRVAHLDTGYDPGHAALPASLRTDLARSFVAGEDPNNATDQVQGPLTNRGHGTGTLGILAGRDPANAGATIGAAPFVEVVPIRVADRVELFYNSAVARALDYVLSLKDDPNKRIDIVTMSMGGLASRAWAEAVNALYEAGIFVVTAAGNNIGNAPTHNIVFPARFNRVVAACGVMADGKPYADLPIPLMAGNYGPVSKMRTAIAAATPNLPWARIGCPAIVDHNGSGTSAATPQVAAAAAIWLARHGRDISYSEPWMRVEAIRAALFGSARAAPPDHFGRGVLDAAAALAQAPASATTLSAEKPDDAAFPFLRTLFGLGLAAPANPGQAAMFELEALQLSQTLDMERILPNPDAPDAAGLVELKAALATHSRTSNALRAALAESVPVSTTAARFAAPDTAAAAPGGDAPPPESAGALNRKSKLARAMAPDVPVPPRRRLRIFASDPSLGAGLDTFDRTVTTVDMPWEKLDPGPIGEYIEVIDVDPASGAAYAPVNLDDPFLLHEAGLAPSETDPRFHQQMVYAVASRTIEHFERALGRKALWSPYRNPKITNAPSDYVQRLRIYPHAMRVPNAYYSPAKKALLLGYFTAKGVPDHPEIAQPAVFAALAHDVIAHETAHALLDGLHRRFVEPTNPDVLAFHEAFADIVAMFQHFTLPDAVRPEIAATRGDLFKQNRLGMLAVQFGQSIGQRGALRDYIGKIDENGHWEPNPPKLSDYCDATDAHDRGAVLVAAVFDAFLKIYQIEARDLFRLASGGSGLVPEGELAAPLVDALTRSACQIAHRFLNIMIRALDYCPPIDITFGEYLRAVITADCDVVPNDVRGYRVAIVAAFRARGISPLDVRTVSPDTLAWEPPDENLSFNSILGKMTLDWPSATARRDAFDLSSGNAALFHQWLVSPEVPDTLLTLFGVRRTAGPLAITVPADGDSPARTFEGNVHGPEVHSVRTLRRVGPDGTTRADLIVEITQSWHPAKDGEGLKLFRGGCTLIINRTTGMLDHLIRKRVDNGGRFGKQHSYVGAPVTGLRASYFPQDGGGNEPFAALHIPDFE